jgi:mannosyltransferase OCH1-like enzyme
MIPRIIHQIYFDFGSGSYRNIPDYARHHDLTEVFCRDNKIELRFWNEEEVETLIEEHYPEFFETYHEFPHKIQKVDFAKYIILHKFGGIYLDMDVKPLQSLEDLFKRDFFFVRWNSDKNNKPYNAVMGTSMFSPLFYEILLHSCESFEEKKDMPIYKKWFGRFVFQTTGHFMLNRVLKKNKISIDNILNIMFIHNPMKKICEFPGTGNQSLFSDCNTSAWYKESKKESFLDDGE